MLIALTWLSVKIYSRNFKPLVWLWNKISCFRTTKDSKTTVIDIFATFFLLSYTKLCVTSMMFFTKTNVYSVNDTCESYVFVDPSISYLSGEHIPYVVVAAIVLLAFGVLPALLLAVYPIRKLRCLLLLDRLGGRSSIILNIFLEKFYSCYRDGLDGGRDMRSFASLHLFIRILGILVGNWTYSGASIFFGGCCLMIMFVRPCKKTYMNNIDALILALMSLNALQIHLLLCIGRSNLYTWSFLATLCFPTFVLYFNFIPHKYFTYMKGKCTSTASSFIRIIFCCNFEAGEIQVRESDVPNPDRMLYPNRYPDIRGINEDTYENDALLKGPAHDLYLSIN